ncbi:MAG: hypothetical protein H6562_00525 [Lewinellaceae bacterium]|nr:hypothetical protein [Lewinellaceae bacterium]
MTAKKGKIAPTVQDNGINGFFGDEITQLLVKVGHLCNAKFFSGDHKLKTLTGATIFLIFEPEHFLFLKMIRN